MNDFVAYCKNKICYSFLVVVVLLSYGVMIFNRMIGIDDELIDGYVAYGLIAQGRVGWKIANTIFPAYLYLPTWEILIGICLVLFDCVFAGFVIEKYWKLSLSKALVNLIIAVFISFPHIAKFAIYCGNMLTMGYVLGFTVLAIMTASQLLDDKNSRKTYVILVMSLLVVFLFEKAYITFFCQGVAAYALICRSRDKKNNILHIIRWAIKLLGMIAITFIVSRFIIFGIQNLYQISNSSYTNNFIQYDMSSIHAFWMSLKQFIDYFALFYIKTFNVDAGWNLYRLTVMVALVYAIWQAIKKRDAWIFILMIVNIFLSVSVFGVTGAFNLPQRSTCFNFAIFVVIAFVFFLDNISYSQSKKVLLCILCLYIVGMQSKAMTEVYYDKLITYEKDKRLAEDILDKIGETCGRTSMVNKPIIFMGFLDDTYITSGEIEKTSIFNAARYASSVEEETSGRVFKFYKELGYELPAPDANFDFLTVREKMSDMVSYPQIGCVKEMEDCIIVKLGDGLCEILSDNYCVNGDSEKLIGDIEVFSAENQTLYIRGWCTVSNEDSFNNNFSLILHNNKESYRIRLDEMNRPDVTLNHADGYNYDHSGFTTYTTISIPNIVEKGEYNLAIELRKGNEIYWYDVEEILLIHK